MRVVERGIASFNTQRRRSAREHRVQTTDEKEKAFQRSSLGAKMWNSHPSYKLRDICLSNNDQHINRFICHTCL
jgi:hypothetical protein